MNISDFILHFTRFFKNSPKNDQINALNELEHFINNHDEKIFILNGYAGTGKTSLVAALVNMIEHFGINCMMLAPTGRAAKVLAAYANHSAFTIHKIIFRQSGIELNHSFSVSFNKMKNVIFVIDEASMINNSENMNSLTDGVLDSLMDFVFQSDNGCKILFVGDNAQLPPVGQNESPALNPNYYKDKGLKVRTASLKTVVRQVSLSGILENATSIRMIIENALFNELPKIKFNQFPDVINLKGNELIDTLTMCYDHDGMEETMVVCRSNKTTNIYNNGIRNTILWRESELESGELVMIAKNNYFWTQTDIDEMGEDEKILTKQIDFIANGDVAVIDRVRNHRELYGFRFADCSLHFPDYDDFEMEATVILDTLQAEAPALNNTQQENLFNRIMEDYMDIPNKKQRTDKIKQDPYFNALQIKYAYAVTCHKAQGGQWKNVFVDQGYIPDDTDMKDYCRWLYTAITRAKNKLFLVNWKQNQTEP